MQHAMTHRLTQEPYVVIANNGFLVGVGMTLLVVWNLNHTKPQPSPVAVVPDETSHPNNAPNRPVTRRQSI